MNVESCVEMTEMMNRPNVKERRRRKLTSRKRSPDRNTGEKRNEKQQQEKRNDKENWGNRHIGVIGNWRGRAEGEKENLKRRKETVTIVHFICGGGGVCVGGVCSRYFVKGLTSVVAGVSISKKRLFCHVWGRNNINVVSNLGKNSIDLHYQKHKIQELPGLGAGRCFHRPTACNI